MQQSCERLGRHSVVSQAQRWMRIGLDDWTVTQGYRGRAVGEVGEWASGRQEEGDEKQQPGVSVTELGTGGIDQTTAEWAD